jgi:hypothetical protein
MSKSTRIPAKWHTSLHQSWAVDQAWIQAYVCDDWLQAETELTEKKVRSIAA